MVFFPTPHTSLQCTFLNWDRQNAGGSFFLSISEPTSPLVRRRIHLHSRRRRLVRGRSAGRCCFHVSHVHAARWRHRRHVCGISHVCRRKLSRARGFVRPLWRRRIHVPFAVLWQNSRRHCHLWVRKECPLDSGVRSLHL